MSKKQMGITKSPSIIRNPGIFPWVEPYRPLEMGDCCLWFALRNQIKSELVKSVRIVVIKRYRGLEFELVILPTGPAADADIPLGGNPPNGSDWQ